MLWIVVDDNNHWLYYGRETLEEAIKGAKEAGDYDDKVALLAYSVDSEIVIEPDGEVRVNDMPKGCKEDCENCLNSVKSHCPFMPEGYQELESIEK